MRLSRYRTVSGEYGDPYPQWMRDLRDERGVYVIIDRDTGQPLWVGESDSDLRKTITRHFQAWERESRSAETPHYEYARAGVYARDEVQVAVAIADDETSKEIYNRESDFLCALVPLDNEQKMWRCYGDPDYPDEYIPSPKAIEDALEEHMERDDRWAAGEDLPF